jgi:hypothetical protein
MGTARAVITEDSARSRRRERPRDRAVIFGYWITTGLLQELALIFSRQCEIGISKLGQ